MYKKIKHSLMAEAADYAFDHCLPIFTTLELSQYCNFSCKHCYNFDRSDEQKLVSRSSPLSTDRWLTLIDQLVAEGGFYIALTGGEPLTHPDLFTLIDRIREHHCIARVKTNGSLLSKQTAIKLFDHGVYSMDISFYGNDRDTYKSFCGVDLYSSVVSGIRNAIDAGISVTLNILLHRGNYKQLGDMISFAEGLGVEFNITDEITERYDGTGGESLWRLQKDDLEWLFQSPYKDYFMYENKDGNVQCSCARTVCGVGADGDVFPCVGAPIQSGNILEHSFGDIWRRSNELNDIRKLKESDFTSCQGCSLRSSCSRSSGTVYVNTGDYTGCEDFTKLTASLRRKYR